MTHRIARMPAQRRGHHIPATMLTAIMVIVAAAGFPPVASAQWAYSSGQQWSYGETEARSATDGTAASTPTNTLSQQERSALAETQAVAAETSAPRTDYPPIGASSGGTGATDSSYSRPAKATNGIADSDRDHMGSAEMKVYQACGTSEQQSAAWENPETGHSGQYYVTQSGSTGDGRSWFKVQGTGQFGTTAWSQTATILKNMDSGTWSISEISTAR